MPAASRHRASRAIAIAGTLVLASVVAASAAATPAQFSIAPVPIAAKASLTSGTAVSVTVTAKDGNGAAIPGATIYLDFFATDPGSGGTAGSAAVGATTLGGSAQPFTANANGQVVVTYTAGSALAGADLLRAKDAAGTPAVQSNDSYCYNPGDMLIKPSPVAAPSALLAGAVAGGSVTVVDKNGSAVPNAHVWLAVSGIGDGFPSIFQNPVGSARAKSATSSSWVTLTKDAKEFVANGSGSVPVFYRAPTLLPGNKTDALVSQDKGTRGCIKTSHYDFGPIPSGTRTDRIAGQDRYNTASAISKTYQAYGTSDTVFIATGLNYPDALAGAAAAGKVGAPVLLVGKSVPATTLNELSRLKPTHIVILGGTGVVSAAMESQLRSYAPDVTRYGGSDRYGTARLIAEHFFAGGADTVFVATGKNFPDALAGAAIAGHVSAPILLVDGGSKLPASTAAALSALHPKQIAILGGTGVVPVLTENQLKPFASVGVSRYAGADRYATAAAIAKAYYSGGANIAMVATGENFPDALAGAAPAATLAAPILLVKASSVPASTLSALSATVNPHSIAVLGGTGVVSDAVKAQLSTLTP